MLAGKFLPAPNYDVAVDRIEFDEAGNTPCLFSHDERRSRAPESVQDQLTTMGDIANRVSHQGDGLDRGMGPQFLQPVRFEGIYAWIAPHIRPVAPFGVGAFHEMRLISVALEQI